jgi:hypothetical protein
MRRVIRWTWGYDADGRRVTEAEPVGYRECHGHGHPAHLHPVATVDLALLPGRSAREIVGYTSGQFPPDDDE